MVAPADHYVDGEEVTRSCPVWLGLGRIAARDELVVFLFKRTSCPWLSSFMEFLYCVLPVVANIKCFQAVNQCVFQWSVAHDTAQGMSCIANEGCCKLRDIDDKVGLLKAIQEAFAEAVKKSLVFHEEQKVNHREVWAYRDYLPLELARLPSSSVRVAGRRTLLGKSLGLKTRALRLLSVTWNVGATSPKEDQSLVPILKEESAADVVIVGLQETCELSAKRLLQDGDEWYEWKEWIENNVEEAYNDELALLDLSHLVGMLLCVFIRKSLVGCVHEVRNATLGIGVGGVGGNKGAVGVRFMMGESSFCVLNTHLAAGQEHYIERCQNFSTITDNFGFPENQQREEEADPEERKRSSSFFRTKLNKAVTKVKLVHRLGGGDILHSRLSQLSSVGSFSAPQSFLGGPLPKWRVEDHDHIIWIGDTNSRLHYPGKTGGVPLAEAKEKIDGGRWGELLALDQLNLSRRDCMAFEGYEEHKIRFLPSYKWRPGEDAFDMRKQNHVPAWTDRVLYRSTKSPQLECMQYNVHMALKQSDHRPVYACLEVQLNVKDFEDHSQAEGKGVTEGPGAPSSTASTATASTGSRP